MSGKVYLSGRDGDRGKHRPRNPAQKPLAFSRAWPRRNGAVNAARGSLEMAARHSRWRLAHLEPAWVAAGGGRLRAVAVVWLAEPGADGTITLNVVRPRWFDVGLIDSAQVR
ncbi:hypothetical protein Aple_086480 [Acrocarpospora pleiomorpha]|uniref:Uncharacterized protein n=1 Tax=Acrocarpospora pleiomorpha TaxID=90975 RepID=A0A5M3Y0Q3_9ACTN|nr:hypothetical protein Aple_086480 [Acrocarpospora pleiomorpha]